jgi:DNA replication protein DnaC
LIKNAKFENKKTIDTFEFEEITSLNKKSVLELIGCEYIVDKRNIIILGNSGVGKTHIATSLGMEACKQGFSTRFISAVSLVNEMIESRTEKQLLSFMKKMRKIKLLIIDELGYVPFSKTGAELLFDLISQRYEVSSTIITSNLPFAEWTDTFGSEKLTGALLDRLTHHVQILEMNGESYRLKQSKNKKP